MMDKALKHKGIKKLIEVSTSWSTGGYCNAKQWLLLSTTLLVTIKSVSWATQTTCT